MIDGMVRSILHVLGITPEEAKSMADDVVNNVRTVDARLERIERHLGIPDDESLTIEGTPANERTGETNSGSLS